MTDIKVVEASKLTVSFRSKRGEIHKADPAAARLHSSVLFWGSSGRMREMWRFMGRIFRSLGKMGLQR